MAHSLPHARRAGKRPPPTSSARPAPTSLPNTLHLAAHRLASALGVPFIDTDKRIVAEHGAIAEIFETQGEPAFRAIERGAVIAALREDAVVSLGGGAVLDRETRRDLAEHHVILLTVTAEAVAARIPEGGGKRPLLRDGIAAWEALVATRMPVYESLATAVVDTSSGHMEQVVADVLATIPPHSPVDRPEESR